MNRSFLPLLIFYLWDNILLGEGEEGGILVAVSVTCFTKTEYGLFPRNANPKFYLLFINLFIIYLFIYNLFIYYLFIIYLFI